MKAFFLKLLAALAIAAPLYWKQIPEPILTLMSLAGLDLLMGVLVSIILGEFKARKLLVGIIIKSCYFILLAACHSVENPLGLDGYHLEKYVAYTLIAYEFISLVENYAKVRPLPRILVLAVKRANELIAVDEPLSMERKITEKTIGSVPTLSDPHPPAPIVIKTDETVIKGPVVDKKDS